ncbi:MauE/DoxX family redox-associated membrane protein [Herbiconiux sp. P17]|uniref:MauE/DoxX family redox-associated membrane protein n=1 Tax=Herbiconiux wuyangfengii TaxID=3342794 RepID=UPI0035B985C1
MAPSLLVLILWSLALVLLVSGALKLGRSAETLRSLDELRVPRALRRRWLAEVLPFLELIAGLGLLLAPAPVFTVAALGASALFALFFALTLAVVARGESVVCACFGARSTRPIDSFAVARNALLLAGAVAATVGAREGAVPWMLGFGLVDWTVFLAAATVLLAIGVTVLLVGRSRSPRDDARPASPTTVSSTTASPGAATDPWPVPDLEVTDATGRAVELASVARDRPVLLVLLSAECTPCGIVADRIAGWRELLGEAVEIAVLTSETPEAFDRRYPRLEARMLFGYRSLMTATGIAGVPSAMLLGTDRMVAAGPAQGLDEVVELTDAVFSVIPARESRAISSSHGG